MREFSELSKVAEAAGGKVKYRTVQTGRIPSDTFKKACGEMGVAESNLGEVFRREGGDFVLIETSLERSTFVETCREPRGRV